VKRLLKQFIEEGSVVALDTSCVRDIQRPDFLVP
jgi:hypothetical protein